MNCVLTHQSALKYYRWFRGFRNKSFKRDLRVLDKYKIPVSYTQNIAAYTQSLTNNLFNEKKPQILISSQNKKHISRFVNVMCSGLNYPRYSFLQIDDALIIPKPELLFYQLAVNLDFTASLLVGLELCGSYSMPNEDADNFTTGIRAVTTASEITVYLKKLRALNKNPYGISKALSLAKLLKDRSASPQESRLYIMLCSPRRYGGYNLNNFVFNQHIKMTYITEKLSRQYTIIPDISNPKKKIAIEYDSAIFHNNIKQDNKDKLRSNAMQSNGWKLFTFLKSHISDVEFFHFMAIEILKANGQDGRIRSKKFYFRRDELFKKLYLSRTR